MVLPMGFHNLQKLLPWEYLLKKKKGRNKLWKSRQLLGALCQFFPCYATEFQESGSGFKIKLGIKATQCSSKVSFLSVSGTWADDLFFSLRYIYLF